MSDLEEFHHELIADIQSGADANGLFMTEAFFEKMGEILTEAGELDGADYARFEGTGDKGVVLQIDGSGGDPRDADGILSLILCDYQPSEEIRKFGAAELKARLNRLVNFLRHARREEFRERLEETSEGYMLADMITTTWSSISKIKLILITNAEKRSKADALPIGTIDERPVTYTVWDLERIRKFIRSGQTREDISIAFREDFGEAIPVLRASASEGGLESYIAVIRGSQLGEIYDRWGTRLLEANVRSFLQARGKVNRGIRDTLEDEPELFFAYNNGITATADGVTLEQTAEGPVLVAADNLQIVNGGQTTASIHAARKARPKKPKARLEKVFVQMKLNVVPSERSEDVIPNISLYANSQNKVNDADLSSNHPFQRRIQEYSRRILAPKAEGSYQETKWFYERARGQYPDERARLTDAARKKFDLENPRVQYFTKTDLAKFENSWAGLPHIVSRGAQKNFIEFAREIAKEWKKSEERFDETWYRRMIAKAIIFRRLEKVVPEQPWYEGGYRANIVTYAMAKLAHDVQKRDRVMDLDRIWRLQAVPKVLEDALLVASSESHDVITTPPEGLRNLSEWAKKQACWAEFARRELAYPDEFDELLIEPEEAATAARDSRNDKREASAIEDQRAVIELGAEFWHKAKTWAETHRALSPREAGILGACANMPSRLPSDKQCRIAMEVLDRLEADGFEGRVPAPT